MRFDEKAVDAGRDRRPRQHGRHGAIAAGAGALAAGTLHGMGRVEDHAMARLPHDRQATHVDDEVMIAEGRAALGDEVILGAGLAQLGRDVVHVLRGEELPFLHVDCAAAFGRRDEQVGLPAKEGGNLQDIDDLGGLLHLGNVMDVGEHRAAEPFFDGSQDFQPLRQARPAKRFAAGPVGLVERRLENERNAQVGGQLDEMLRDGHRQRLRFKNARPGDEEKTFGGRSRQISFHGKDQSYKSGSEYEALISLGRSFPITF